jgi:hypothetical protein
MDRAVNRRLWFLLGMLAGFSLSLFLIPGFIIRPFTHQSEWGLRLALAVKGIAPALTLSALLVMLAVSWSLWRSSSPSKLKLILSRTCIVALLALSVVSAVMVRQNYFEWMFNPIRAAGFVSPGDAKLDNKEMVMVVRIGQETRAYPILQMAYHHILNDTVADVPIVVTY